MVKITIKGLYTTLGKIEASKDKFQFHITTPEAVPASVHLNIKAKLIESIQEVEVSEQLIKEMEADKYDKLPERLELELCQIKSGVAYAARRVVSLIKYCLSQHTINESLLSLKGIYWSKDGSTWNQIRPILKVTAWSSKLTKLDSTNQLWIQDFEDSNYQPFLALRHLHRAQNENNPRYKWIDATIAAELAIKEFLIRWKPELETLLVEVPSPPLYKMYGSILNEYSGNALPRGLFKSLSEGAEMRNKLLHRPHEQKIDRQKAIDYTNDVAEAIKHLIVKLYPDKHIII